MKRSNLLLLFVFSTLAAGLGAAEKTAYYSIKMNNKLIGYAQIGQSKVREKGRELLLLHSETVMKVALLGKERTTRLTSKTFLDPQTKQPLRYDLIGKTNDVVQHVQSTFEKGKARTWIYRGGDPKGEAVVTDLAKGTVILGSNNFAHWRRLAEAITKRVTDGKVSVPIFLPDARLTTNFKLTRGKSVEVDLPESKRNCTVWQLEGGINVLIDAKTNEFVGMELPSQKTVIMQTDQKVIKLAQKSNAEEVLARHFAQSNVIFDDFLKVDRLEAQLDVQVIGSGINNDVSVLTTAMQKFDGKKVKEHVVGQVQVRRVRYDSKRSPVFPTDKKAQDESLSEWLKPTTYIESDHAAIVAQARELTKGAKTRWQAVKQIGDWVYKEIAYTIADTPSARLALEKKQGDCGPHSTLMVAMLRSVGIPSRLVGGLVYTPTFGGSFGQHAWVEVHMGETGWLAMDPTTGEFESMSATHVKLFSGIGGVLPKSLKVISFDPPNRKSSSAGSAKARPLAWKLDKEHVFKFTKGGKDLGSESFTIKEIERDGKKVYELTSKLKLKISLLASLVADSKLVVAKNGQPLSYDRELAAGLQKIKIECVFAKGQVKTKISGSKNLARDIKLPEGAYCFDNNFMGCFALICSQLKLEAEKAVTIRTFHPSSLQIISLTLTPKKAAPRKIGGKEVDCFECEVAPIKNTFWITRDGRFVRVAQGDLVIELEKLE